VKKLFHLERKSKNDPGLRRLSYVRGMLRKRIWDADTHKYDGEFMEGLRLLRKLGWTFEDLEEH
jgi:hypothetical protein